MDKVAIAVFKRSWRGRRRRISLSAGSHSRDDEKFRRNGAAISVMARQLGSKAARDQCGKSCACLQRSGWFRKGIAAMTQNKTVSKRHGHAARLKPVHAVDENADLLIGGEMGIGNTTRGHCSAQPLARHSPSALAGPGTGLNPEGVAPQGKSHRARVATAWRRYRPTGIVAATSGRFTKSWR